MAYADARSPDMFGVLKFCRASARADLDGAVALSVAVITHTRLLA
jgi:hypothetical protein